MAMIHCQAIPTNPDPTIGQPRAIAFPNVDLVLMGRLLF